MNVFVFDIETVPDVEAGRRIHGLADSLSDKSVAELNGELEELRAESRRQAHRIEELEKRAP